MSAEQVWVHPYSKGRGRVRGHWRRISRRSVIGISPARSSTSVIAHAEAYFDTPRYRQFERSLVSGAEERGIRIDNLQRSVGIWEGEMEPSALLRVRGPANLRGYLGKIGRQFNQDAVIVFRPNRRSHDALYRLPGRGPADRDLLLGRARELGIQGATIVGYDLWIADVGRKHLEALKKLSADAGIAPEIRPGRIRFLNRGRDYEELGRAAGGRRAAGGGGDHRGSAGLGDPDHPGPAGRDGARELERGFADWNPADHPRHRKGEKGGGKFRRKAGLPLKGTGLRFRGQQLGSRLPRTIPEFLAELYPPQPSRRPRPGKGRRSRTPAGPSPQLPPPRMVERPARRLRLDGTESILWSDFKAHPPEGVTVRQLINSKELGGGDDALQQVLADLDNLTAPADLSDLPDEEGAALGAKYDQAVGLIAAEPLTPEQQEVLDFGRAMNIPPERLMARLDLPEPYLVVVPKSANVPVPSPGQELVIPRPRPKPLPLPQEHPLAGLSMERKLKMLDAHNEISRAETSGDFSEVAETYLPGVEVNLDGVVNATDWADPGEHHERVEEARGIMLALVDAKLRDKNITGSKNAIFDYVGSFDDVPESDKQLDPEGFATAYAITLWTGAHGKLERDTDRSMIFVNPDPENWRTTSRGAEMGGLAVSDVDSYGRITHELGHVWMAQVGIDTNEERAQLQHAMVDSAEAIGMTPADMSRLSEYAAMTMQQQEPAEMFAEIWSLLRSEAIWAESFSESDREMLFRYRDELNARYGRRIL